MRLSTHSWFAATQSLTTSLLSADASARNAFSKSYSNSALMVNELSHSATSGNSAAKPVREYV